MQGGQARGPCGARDGEDRAGARRQEGGEAGRAQRLVPGWLCEGVAGEKELVRNGGVQKQALQAEGQQERWGKPSRAVAHCF